MKKLLGVLIVSTLLAATAWSAEAPPVYDKKCKACHSIGGVGGPMAKMGGPLDGVGAQRDAAWLKAFLKDPKSQMPNAKMPKVSLTDDEVDALVNFMLTLKTPAK